MGKKRSRTWISGYFSSYDAALQDAKKEKATYEGEGVTGYANLYAKDKGKIIVDAVTDKRSLFTKIIYQRYRPLGDNPDVLYRAESFGAEGDCPTCKDNPGSYDYWGNGPFECYWCSTGGGMRAESFGAEEDYVVVDRGNYRVRVHKRNLDKHGKETMSKIHSEANRHGLMYDEETARWISLNAESFEACGKKHYSKAAEDGWTVSEG